RESRSAGTAAWSRPGAPNVPADGARASSSRLVRARGDVGGEEALEAREVAVVRGGGELVDEPPVLAGVDGDGVALGEPRSGAPCEQASVGLAEVEDLRDVTVGVPEGLAQDVDRALDGREPCEERESRDLDRLDALGARGRVRGRVDRFGDPRPDAG